MEAALSRAQALISSYDEELRRLLPEGAEIFDAHLHLGHDIDGVVNLAAPNPVTNAQFADALGKALGRPTILPTPPETA